MDTETVILQCGHSLRLPHPPRQAQKRYPLWCQRCSRYVGLAGMNPPEWHAVCKACRYRRAAGQSESLAELYANQHGTKHPLHRVTVEWISPIRYQKGSVREVS